MFGGFEVLKLNSMLLAEFRGIPFSMLISLAVAHVRSSSDLGMCTEDAGGHALFLSAVHIFSCQNVRSLLRSYLYQGVEIDGVEKVKPNLRLTLEDLSILLPRALRFFV